MCEVISKLSEFAKTQPHAAYSAFCHGEVRKFLYFLRTIPDMQEYIKPLDALIRNEFIPTLLQAIITDQDRVLYSLPEKHRGLGIPILSEISEIHYEHCKSYQYLMLQLLSCKDLKYQTAKL